MGPCKLVNIIGRTTYISLCKEFDGMLQRFFAGKKAVRMGFSGRKLLLVVTEEQPVIEVNLCWKHMAHALCCADDKCNAATKQVKEQAR